MSWVKQAGESRNAGVPLRLLQMVAAGELERGDAVEEADAWYARWRDRPLLALIGKRGTGKTVAAVYALWRVGRNIRRVTHDRIARNLRDARWLDELEREPGLLIDDLGAGRNDDWVWPVINGILDERYMYRLPTVVTSNLDYEGFTAVVGDRIVDRFAEAGKIVEVAGRSFREQPAEPMPGAWDAYVESIAELRGAAEQASRADNEDELRAIVLLHRVSWDEVTARGGR